MKNKWFIPLLAFALLRPALAQDSCDVSLHKYRKASLLSSYVPLFLFGAVVSMAQSPRQDDDPSWAGDDFPDIFTPMLYGHLVVGSYLALSSTLGTVCVGYDKKHIFSKNMLTYSLVMASSVALFYVAPFTPVLFLLYDFAIPFITAKTAQRIDEKFVRQSRGFTLVPSIQGTRNSISFSVGIVF